MLLTPEEWAAWALMGDPYARVPETLEFLRDRIVAAVQQAVLDVKEEVEK